MNRTDITFIGSGIATTVTLIALFDKLLQSAEASRTLTIDVIEKHPELWMGLPYGSRSSVNALSITCAHDFIHEPERPAFFEWLKSNKAEWTEWYRAQGGDAAARWLEKNLILIDNEDWETIYIPRFLLGKYLLEKLTRLSGAVHERNLVTLNVLRGEAVDIELKEDGAYEVVVESENKTRNITRSKKVVASIGSGPIKKMYDNAPQNLLYINNIYEPGTDYNISNIQKALDDTGGHQSRNILVIGSNASSIELLYLFEGLSDMRKLIHKTVVMSPSGTIPYHISNATIAHATPSQDKLEADGGYTLQDLTGATSKDLTLAVQNGANVAYIATIISRAFKLLEVLGDDAKKTFIGIHGMKLSHMFRRAGPEYRGSAQSLIDSGEVILLKGKFLNMATCENGATLKYQDSEGNQQTYPLNFNIVINSCGSENLDESSSMLVRNLLRRKMGNINLSGKGFEVNEKFEMAPNLYVTGPLLGGNMNKLIQFWHLENAPRLMYLAPYLADALLDRDQVL